MESLGEDIISLGTEFFNQRDSILILLLFTVIICVIICFFLYKPSGFWTHQPVVWNRDGMIEYPGGSYTKLKQGVLGTIPNHIITLKDSEMTIDMSPIDFEETYKFLFREFSNHYNIQYEY